MKVSTSYLRLVLFPFSDGQIGGSHISSMLLADILRDEHGYGCVFACPNGTALARLASERGHLVSTSPLGSANTLGNIVSGLPWRWQLVRSKGDAVKIVHCNDFPTLAAWVPLRPLIKAPIVYHHRSLNQMTWKKCAVTRQASHVFCISDATFDNLAFIGRDRRTLLLNPFRFSLSPDRKSDARARLLADLGMSNDVELIGFVGNLWRRKRPEMFIEISARLASSRPMARFLIFGRAGDVSEDEIRTRIGALGLSERVHFVGFRLPPEDNLAALDLLLAPAMAEPFGRTLVEATLCGTPYVAADDAGHTEIARRWGGGLLVRDTENVDAFVAASLRALRSAGSLVLTNSQRSQVLSDLSPTTHGRTVATTYARLCKFDTLDRV